MVSSDPGAADYRVRVTEMREAAIKARAAAIARDGIQPWWTTAGTRRMPSSPRIEMKRKSRPLTGLAMARLVLG